MDKENTFFCTRPKLAALLIESGFNGRRVVNPFNTKYAAWEFDETPELHRIVSEFYLAVNGGEGR